MIFGRGSDMNATVTKFTPLARRIGIALALAAAMAGCRKRDSMRNQPRQNPLDESTFFADGKSARPVVPGTIAVGHLQADKPLYTGRDANGELVSTFPYALTEEDIERGRERFNIYCALCHGQRGDGNGMIVQRGFLRPPSFFTDRLVKDPKSGEFPAGHFFDVISNGYGAMYSYNDRIEVRDRWAIIGYIRAIQLSHVNVAELSAEDRKKLESEPR